MCKRRRDFSVLFTRFLQCQLFDVLQIELAGAEDRDLVDLMKTVFAGKPQIGQAGGAEAVDELVGRTGEAGVQDDEAFAFAFVRHGRDDEADLGHLVFGLAGRFGRFDDFRSLGRFDGVRTLSCRLRKSCSRRRVRSRNFRS